MITWKKNPLEVRDWIKKIDKKAARINSRLRDKHVT